MGKSLYHAKECKLKLRYILPYIHSSLKFRYILPKSFCPSKKKYAKNMSIKVLKLDLDWSKHNI